MIIKEKNINQIIMISVQFPHKPKVITVYMIMINLWEIHIEE